MHENDIYQSQDTEYRLLSGKEGWRKNGKALAVFLLKLH